MSTCVRVQGESEGCAGPSRARGAPSCKRRLRGIVMEVLFRGGGGGELRECLSQMNYLPSMPDAICMSLKYGHNRKGGGDVLEEGREGGRGLAREGVSEEPPLLLWSLA